MCSFPYSLAASRRTEALVTIVSDHCADSVFMPNSAGNPLFLEQVKVALLPLPYYAEFSGEFPFSSPVFNLSIDQLFPTCRFRLVVDFPFFFNLYSTERFLASSRCVPFDTLARLACIV